MEVEAPRTFVFDLDGGFPRVLVRQNFWDKYQEIKNALAPIDIDVNFGPQRLASLLFHTASYSIGYIEIRLTAVAVAIWSLMKLVTVVPYGIVSYPGTFPTRFPFKFGTATYEIEPLDS